MIRTIISIDESRCNGCGACASACHEGAIAMVDGKAKLMREHFCDGLGDCLPACPTGAITFTKREAPSYDAAAVKKAQQEAAKTPCCPGSAPRAVSGKTLKNFPIQIKLAPVRAPYYDGADLLIAADCTAYAYAAFHRELMADRVTLIGCPKLDDVDYSEKLAELFRQNEFKSVTVARMTVPCCGGLPYAVNQAVAKSGKTILVNTVIIPIDGTD